jgi:hypothetical protein
VPQGPSGYPQEKKPPTHDSNLTLTRWSANPQIGHYTDDAISGAHHHHHHQHHHRYCYRLLYYINPLKTKRTRICFI